MKNIAILGSTGSIGRNTLNVVEQFPERFRVVALAAGRNIDLLAEQIQRHRPKLVAVFDQQLARDLMGRVEPATDLHVLAGGEGYQQVAACPEADMVLSAMVGAAGLEPTLSAVRAGKDVALANKETLVMAGALVMEEVRKNGVRLLPVDSEHSAIFQAMEGNRRKDVKRILLTASGGPFLNMTMEQLQSVTPNQALAHPNWVMGPKITIDSATLMNKGLEVIEAKWLFDEPVDKIEVHIHPQSVVHSMVEYVDGSVIAQMGIPDMRSPIAYALAYPSRLPLDLPPLDLFSLKTLTFLEPDLSRFPCLDLAFAACRTGGSMPAVLNAANEVAVQAFLDRRIPFTGIARLVGEAMEEHVVEPAGELEELLEADNWARRRTEESIGGMRFQPS
ncbi:MAG: 1-deoxy-D-xylulose-5-phosphate reductoisomerase [Deltaproteobacteria bacterium]|nr:MAG: 1-deoxy-D-xylulose-5-phosphate reductoisomerase [Deltaproteobacteria bacterium]